MHPQQLRHAYPQCGAETDRLAPPAHRTAHQFRLRGRGLATVGGGRRVAATAKTHVSSGLQVCGPIIDL